MFIFHISTGKRASPVCLHTINTFSSTFFPSTLVFYPTWSKLIESFCSEDAVNPTMVSGPASESLWKDEGDVGSLDESGITRLVTPLTRYTLCLWRLCHVSMMLWRFSPTWLRNVPTCLFAIPSCFCFNLLLSWHSAEIVPDMLAVVQPRPHSVTVVVCVDGVGDGGVRVERESRQHYCKQQNGEKIHITSLTSLFYLFRKNQNNSLSFSHNVETWCPGMIVMSITEI